MAKVNISANYSLGGQTKEIKQETATHPYLSVINGVETLTTSVKEGQGENIRLIGNRIKIKDLDFDEDETIYWLEKTDVPYLEERGMSANKWFDLYSLRDVTDVFNELPDKIFDYPAANPNGNRTLDFAVCVPVNGGDLFYMRAVQKIQAGVCTFEMLRCGLVKQHDADSVKEALYNAIGTGGEIAFPGGIDLQQVYVELDTKDVYEK